MNNPKLALSLNLLLLVAVIILFIKVFTGGNVSENSSSNNNTNTDTIKSTYVPTGSVNIAYVRNDSITAHYKYYVVASKKLEALKADAEKTLKQKADYAMKRQKTLSEQAQFMTKIEEQNAMKELQSLEADYQRKEQELYNKLGEEEKNLTDKLYFNIETFLDKYTADNKIDMVLNFVPRMGFLYISPRMDITSDVVRGLNAEYDRIMSAEK